MPYIKQDDRNIFDPLIDELSKLVPKDYYNRSGSINYIFTSLLSKVYGENMRYADHNDVLGILTGVQLEFYRKRTAPYEDIKIKENGDVA